MNDFSFIWKMWIYVEGFMKKVKIFITQTLKLYITTKNLRTVLIRVLSTIYSQLFGIFPNGDGGTTRPGAA